MQPPSAQALDDVTISRFEDVRVSEAGRLEAQARSSHRQPHLWLSAYRYTTPPAPDNNVHDSSVRKRVVGALL